jgi:7,8-dihydroneopterin aldolase/epimerase/oxygenase
VSDAIVLRGMSFEGRHGVGEEERAEPQEIQLDVELLLDLAAAGASDALEQTVDYSAVFEICRSHVEERSYRLLEALGEAVAGEVLSRFPRVDRVVVEVRKPGVPVDGIIDHAGVRIDRARS